MERTRTPFETQLETELEKQGYRFDDIIYPREQNKTYDERYPVRISVSHVGEIAKLEYQICIYNQSQETLNQMARQELERLIAEALHNNNHDHMLFEETTLYPMPTCKKAQNLFHYPPIYAAAAPLLYEFGENGRSLYNAARMAWRFMNAIDEIKSGRQLTFKKRPPTTRRTAT